MAQGRVIGVVSGKGGVGKTMLTVNLGAALAHEYAKKTVLVDCNIGTSHLGVSLGMHQWPVTINEVLMGKASLSTALAKDEASGMMVLPASLKAEGLSESDLDRIRPLAAKLSQTFDFVLLDGSPGLAAEAMATMEAANELLYVSTPSTPSVMDVVRCRHVIKDQNKKELGVALNLCYSGANQLSPQDVSRMTELEVIAAVPFDVNVERSLAAQGSVIIDYPKSPAAAAILELSSRISGGFKERAEPSGGLKLGKRLEDLKKFIWY